MNDGGQKIKVWKISKDSQAGVMVDGTSSWLVGNKSNFVHASDSGVNISARSIGFMVNSENIRQGGLFVQMNDFTRLIPQTLVTPMPSQVPFPPIGMVQNIVQDLPFFLAMLV